MGMTFDKEYKYVAHKLQQNKALGQCSIRFWLAITLANMITVFIFRDRELLIWFRGAI